MRNSKSPPGELAMGLKLILEKNREALSVTDTELLEEAISLLEKIDNPPGTFEKSDVLEIAGKIVMQLLKFFSENTEIVESISNL